MSIHYSHLYHTRPIELQTELPLKHIQSLRTKKGRKEQGAFIAEGVRLLEEAIRLRFLPTDVYLSRALLSERGALLVDKFRLKNIPVHEVSAKQLERLSETRTPQGIIGVFDTPRSDLIELSPKGIRRLLLCERISDPGNLGTLLRSALAFGFDPVVLTASSVEPYSPKVVRSSAGAVFGLRILQASSPDAIDWLMRHKLPVIAADGRGECDNPALERRVKAGPVALALGSEAEGLSPDIIQASRLVHRVPHETIVESLNVAVAGSILMKQVYDYQ